MLIYEQCLYRLLYDGRSMAAYHSGRWFFFFFFFHCCSSTYHIGWLCLSSFPGRKWILWQLFAVLSSKHHSNVITDKNYTKGDQLGGKECIHRTNQERGTQNMNQLVVWSLTHLKVHLYALLKEMLYHALFHFTPFLPHRPSQKLLKVLLIMPARCEVDCTKSDVAIVSVDLEEWSQMACPRLYP
jgi:hypothetical protein